MSTGQILQNLSVMAHTRRRTGLDNGMPVRCPHVDVCAWVQQARQVWASGLPRGRAGPHPLAHRHPPLRLQGEGPDRCVGTMPHPHPTLSHQIAPGCIFHVQGWRGFFTSGRVISRTPTTCPDRWPRVTGPRGPPRQSSMLRSSPAGRRRSGTIMPSWGEDFFIVSAGFIP